MSEFAALLSVQQSLRQCFDVIEQLQEEWKLAIMDCNSLINTLSNLAEQLQACQKVTFTKTPLSAFTDLQDRLRYKLEAAMDLTLEKLTDNMCILQKVKDSVSHKVGSVLYVYEMDCNKTEERFYNKVDNKLRSDCLAEIKSLPHSWGKLEDKSSSKQQLVQDTLLNVSFFREAV
ncbi:AFG2-interacting ribosome maturation factor isoform X2 [Mixophyes fleayi]|uniref:AFG2-interacting ribosome maturation factor isoform X2 n=1 Tax=Mixophyes fleayi TaxID=3061075 RepID=UPI003F4DE9BE